jgi:hypothetical protein
VSIFLLRRKVLSLVNVIPVSLNISTLVVRPRMATPTAKSNPSGLNLNRTATKLNDTVAT